MKLLFDLFPVILFFAAFKYSEKNPELAASWVGSLLGSAAVDVKQAPILLATVVVIAPPSPRSSGFAYATARSTKCSGSA